MLNASFHTAAQSNLTSSIAVVDSTSRLKAFWRMVCCSHHHCSALLRARFRPRRMAQQSAQWIWRSRRRWRRGCSIATAMCSKLASIRQDRCGDLKTPTAGLSLLGAQSSLQRLLTDNIVRCCFRQWRCPDYRRCRTADRRDWCRFWCSIAQQPNNQQSDCARWQTCLPWSATLA